MDNAPVKVEMDKPMSRREIDRYNELKQLVVKTISASFVEVGKALAEIKKDLLYRAEFKTFEQCSQKLFDVGRHRARQLIEASGAYEDLLTRVNKYEDDILLTRVNKNEESEQDVEIILPISEAQMRPLLKVAEQDRATVWVEAIKTAKNGNPSSGHINKVVKQYLGEEFKEKITRASTAVRDSKLIDKSIKGLFQQLLQEIYDIKKGGYKTTSRLAICNHLDAARSLISGDGDNIEEKRIDRSNREKLMRAGYAFVKINRSENAVMIENRTAMGWQVLATAPAENIDYHLAELLKENDKYLAD